MQVFIYIALFLLGLFVFGTIFLWIKEYAIRRSRSGDKKSDFIKYFVKLGISESLSIGVYQYLQNWMNSKDFPVRPKDNLATIYGIVDEDLDDLVVEIAKANSLEIPINTDYWRKPLITVEDLIQFIASFSTQK